MCYSHAVIMLESVFEFALETRNAEMLWKLHQQDFFDDERVWRSQILRQEQFLVNECARESFTELKWLLTHCPYLWPLLRDDPSQYHFRGKVGETSNKANLVVAISKLHGEAETISESVNVLMAQLCADESEEVDVVGGAYVLARDTPLPVLVLREMVLRQTEVELEQHWTTALLQ